MSSFAPAAPAAGYGSLAGSLVIAAIFFISGMPAIVYQLIWQRALFTIYGINIEAVTVVVAGFLLGLGIGSFAGGQISRRRSLNLLAVFGLIELTVAALGLVSLPFFDYVGRETLLWPRSALILVTLTLLFVPTLFMGATLPILSAYLVARSRNVGRSVGLLYAANTVGSAAACFLSALFLMRIAGMEGSVRIAAAMNVAVASLALATAWRERRFPAPAAEVMAAPAVPQSTGMTRQFAFAILLSGLIGYLALSYEIVWFRAFSTASNTTPAFALILGTYLAGIGNGALRVRSFLARPLSPGAAFEAIATALLATSALGFFLLPIVSWCSVSPLGYFYPMLLLVFVATTLGGTILPILCHHGVLPDDRAGAGVSWVYLANILGSVTGTLVTGFVLMNLLSLAAISVFLALSGVALALLLALRSGLSGSRHGKAILAVGAVATLAIATTSRPLFAGFYDRLLANNLEPGGGKFVEQVENRNGVVTVDSALYVYGNGVYDGRIAIDLKDDENLLIRPFSLSLYHPDPEQVLMIGLGTGAWAQVVANHPQVKHLTVVEINPGYLQIIRKYSVVASLLDNPKVDIVIDDGRRWLNRHPDRKFDAIVQNTTWYYRPNVTNLLSREYIELSAAHLRAGGVLLYNTTGSLRAQRTGCMTLPGGMREINVLVLSPSPLHLDPARLRRTLLAYRIDGRPVLDTGRPAERRRLDQLVSLLAPPPPGQPQPGAVMEDCRGILARSEGLALITDDNMGEEWTAMATTDPLLRRFRSLIGL